MSKLFDDASLAMVPSAYKDGKLYSIRPTDGSGDFTFSRGSNLAATRVDVNGLIEKGRENLLLQSNNFSTSPWESNQSNREAVVSSGASGYDGTNDAWLVLDTTGSGLHQITGETFSLSGIYSASVYAKAYTNSRYLGMAGFGLAGGNEMPVFDLVNGTIDMPSTSSILKDATITSVGNGWYRCSMMFSYSGSSSFSITLCNSATDNSLSGYTYTGTGSNGFYIQDAQLEQGLVATDYIETGTSAAQSGILEDMPRLDYSGSCPALLLEPQRSNIVTQSDANANWNMVANVTNALTQDVLSPEGVYNAWSARRNVNTSGYTYMTNLPVSPNTTYTASIWLKANDLSVCDAVVFNFHPNSFSSKSTILSFEDGSVTGDGVVEPYPNGWYRVSLTSTSNASIGYFDVGLQPLLNGDVYWGGSDGDVLWYAYGTQVEEGSYPTSYIPTYGTSQTRSQEVVGTIDVSSLGVTTGYTLFFEIGENDLDSTTWLIQRNSNGAFLYQQYGYTAILNIPSGVVYPFGLTSGRNKVAIVFDGTNIYPFLNGVKQGTYVASDDWDSFGVLNLNNNPTRVNWKQLLVFPTALTDSECIALTTL